MPSLNLRQKMIGCFFLHILFYITVGITFLKNFVVFNDDVTLLMHAGNLSNICLEIRRYEKNYIINHRDEDFRQVNGYIEEALKAVPEVKKDLVIISQPEHLASLTNTLNEYKKNFLRFRENCTFDMDINQCPAREEVRRLGHELVSITEELVLFEQKKMNSFIETFKGRLVKATLLLVLLSIITIVLLYIAIITPLKKVEKAALAIAKGDFTLMEVDDSKGEVYSVLRAFNKMVSDLEKHQEQLFQAKKLSSIGTLAAGTAHQINNPLNNISTSCQLALSTVDRKKDPLVHKMLETIYQETDRAGEIVRGLLEFSRAHTFSLQPYPLAKLIRKVEQLVSSEIPSGVELQTDIPEDILLMVDVQKLVEAFLNLTMNSIQAIEKGPGAVVIRAVKDIENKQAVITFSDTGVGIKAEHLQKIFDPFFTTKNAENGTGLGLAVVYGIIKKHNGSTMVESEPGKGTNFIITLPLYAGSNPVESVG